ncbi:hypothetical protein GO495_14775 [Chitinophaga oryziterrae]|uniref:Uncharacterized protein n=1 Tax=Chitinophaga oryziterrae TaxID=1031224 RepID=A0A6N8JCM1_9BACT|nr:hypothetical protein [Chitinophaga oryziterrae]MVT41852.1 hypothetical protein [Chitinophaga oryziterrae]
MKKAKIVLTVVAIFAIVGGALAIKARDTNLFYVPSVPGGICSVPVFTTLTTTIPNVGKHLEYSFTTIQPTTTCLTWVTQTI